MANTRRPKEISHTLFPLLVHTISFFTNNLPLNGVNNISLELQKKCQPGDQGRVAQSRKEGPGLILQGVFAPQM